MDTRRRKIEAVAITAMIVISVFAGIMPMVSASITLLGTNGSPGAGVNTTEGDNTTLAGAITFLNFTASDTSNATNVTLKFPEVFDLSELTYDKVSLTGFNNITNITNVTIDATNKTVTIHNETAANITATGRMFTINLTSLKMPTTANNTPGYIINMSVWNDTGNAYDYADIILTVDPNVPNKWYVNTSYEGNTTVGDSIKFGINVTDQYGNLNDTGPYTATIVVLEGAATVSPYNPTTNATGGYYPIWLNATETPTAVKIRVSGSGLTSTTKWFEFFSPVSGIIATVAPEEIYANNTDKANVTVQLVDADGNPVSVPGKSVTISELNSPDYPALGLTFYNITGGNGTTITGTTNSAGIAYFDAKAGSKSGATKLNIVAEGGLYTEKILTLKQAPNATNTGGTVYPAAISTITAGVGKVITATLKDYNASAIKNAADFPIKFNITDGDAKWTENGLKVYEGISDSNGNVSATLYSTNASAANKINVTISVKNETGGWEEVKSFTGITVAPNNATKFKITPAPPVALPTSKGAHQNFTVQLIDDYGNDNKTAGIDIIVTNNKPEYGNMTNGTFYNEQIVTTTGAGGNASFTYYVNVSGVVYTANLDLNASELNITDTITITTSGAGGVDIKANKTNPLVGDSVLLTINITDAEGNRLSLQGVPITLTTTGGTLGDYALISDANGQNFTTLTSTEPGPITVTAYAAGYSDSETVIFSGNATTFVITPEKASLSVGETCNLTIQAKDANGYNTSMYNGKSIAGQTINFIVSPTGATLGTTSTTFDSTGKATNNITSATANTYTITGAGIGTSNTTTVEFTPVEVKNFSVNITPPSITVNKSTTVTVTVTDADTGAAVEGATVNLSGCGVDLSNTTDAAGIATFEVNASSTGNITVTVSKEGYNTKEETITVTPAITLLDYYRMYEDGDVSTVTDTEILKAEDDWVGNVIPPGFDRWLTDEEILTLEDEWVAT